MNKSLILVVEDDTSVRNLITTTLKAHEYPWLYFISNSVSIIRYRYDRLFSPFFCPNNNMRVFRCILDSIINNIDDYLNNKLCIHFCKKNFFFAFNGNMMLFTLSVNMM